MPPERRTEPSYMRGGGGMSEEAARVSGVFPPSRAVLPPAPGGGERTCRVYREGILPWVWPGCCSKVFRWADLTQPGGEFH